MLTIEKDGTVTLPDGRTVCTTAATQFRLNRRFPALSLLPGRANSKWEEARLDEDISGALPRALAERRLALGQTIAMFGTAEGRLADGTVVTAERWWKVCAL